jgi:hypothetical protein
MSLQNHSIIQAKRSAREFETVADMNGTRTRLRQKVKENFPHPPSGPVRPTGAHPAWLSSSGPRQPKLDGDKEGRFHDGAFCGSRCSAILFESERTDSGIRLRTGEIS